MMAAVSRRTKTRALLLAMVAFPVLLQAKVEAVGDVSLVRSLQTVSEVRFLQQNSTDTGFNEAQSWEVLRTTLLLYLPTFVVVILLFCRIRQRHPRVYNVRHTVPRLRSPLAETTHGFVSWMWKVMAIPDDDLFEYCGMDAVCLFRILRLGLRLSGVGVFCSIFLIPVYVTASSEESDHDLWIKTTATNVPSGSQRFTATVLTVYIIMGYTMHLVLSEFQWLTLTRQKYLTNKIVRNYTVYVSGIPEQHRSNVALARFFRRVISEDSVVSASVALNIPKLNAAVNRRENLQRQLERAQVLQQDANINNEPLTTSVTTDAGTTIMEAAPAIAHYQEQLKIVQQEIQNLRLSIAARQEEANVCDKASSSWRPAEHASSSIVSSSLFVGSSNNNLVSSGVNKGNTPLALDNKENATWTSEVKLYSDKKDMLFEGVTLGQHDGLPREGSSSSHLTTRRKTDTCTSGDCEPPNAEEDCLDSLAADEVEAETNRCFPNEIPSLGIIDIVSQGITAVGLGGDDEGKPFDAGFVTFTRLSAVTVALQVVHSTTPFQMQVEDAPSPEEVLWSNVGVAHHALQLGKLLAFSITATLCIFWTVPVTFLVSLTEVNALKTSMPFLQDWLVAAPWLEGLLNQVSPMLLSFLDSVVLPLILREVSKFEGVLGLSHLEASLFFKLAAFRVSVAICQV